MQYIANITIVTGVPGNQIEIAPGSAVKGLDAEEIERLLEMGEQKKGSLAWSISIRRPKLNFRQFQASVKRKRKTSSLIGKPMANLSQ